MHATPRGGRIRGGSTISQQTAKNVFLVQGGGYVRKAFEAYFTVLIEHLWGKRRIMEVYLNVAETGIGTYGVNAGAMRYFGHDASRLRLPSRPHRRGASAARRSARRSRRAATRVAMATRSRRGVGVVWMAVWIGSALSSRRRRGDAPGGALSERQLEPRRQRQAGGHLGHLGVRGGIGLGRASLNAAAIRSSSICFSTAQQRFVDRDAEDPALGRCRGP